MLPASDAPTGYPATPVLDPNLNYPLPQSSTTGVSVLTTTEGSLHTGSAQAQSVVNTAVSSVTTPVRTAVYIGHHPGPHRHLIGHHPGQHGVDWRQQTCHCGGQQAQDDGPNLGANLDNGDLYLYRNQLNIPYSTFEVGQRGRYAVTPVTRAMVEAIFVATGWWWRRG